VDLTRQINQEIRGGSEKYRSVAEREAVGRDDAGVGPAIDEARGSEVLRVDHRRIDVAVKILNSFENESVIAIAGQAVADDTLALIALLETASIHCGAVVANMADTAIDMTLMARRRLRVVENVVQGRPPGLICTASPCKPAVTLHTALGDTPWTIINPGSPSKNPHELPFPLLHESAPVDFRRDSRVLKISRPRWRSAPSSSSSVLSKAARRPACSTPLHTKGGMVIIFSHNARSGFLELFGRQRGGSDMPH